MNERSANSMKDTAAARGSSRMTLPSQRTTGHKTNEEEHRLLEKITALEAELALYRSALENSKAEMQSFAYSVSHDLRAPLRAIEGFSKILLDDYSRNLDAEAQRFLRHIVTNTEVLGSQIEDLLRFYRIGKTPPARVPANADAICREAIDGLGPRGTDKVSIPALLPVVFADPVKLREVFSELLGNALKFTATAPDRKIEVRASEETNATRFSVSDNGVGFDPQYSGKLFQVFQKLHPASEYKGNGIGLAIVKRVVQAHGGYVDAQGSPGKGAIFSFTLPHQTS